MTQFNWREELVQAQNLVADINHDALIFEAEISVDFRIKDYFIQHHGEDVFWNLLDLGFRTSDFEAVREKTFEFCPCCSDLSETHRLYEFHQVADREHNLVCLNCGKKFFHSEESFKLYENFSKFYEVWMRVKDCEEGVYYISLVEGYMKEEDKMCKEKPIFYCRSCGEEMVPCSCDCYLSCDLFQDSECFVETYVEVYCPKCYSSETRLHTNFPYPEFNEDELYRAVHPPIPDGDFLPENPFAISDDPDDYDEMDDYWDSEEEEIERERLACINQQMPKRWRAFRFVQKAKAKKRAQWLKELKKIRKREVSLAQWLKEMKKWNRRDNFLENCDLNRMCPRDRDEELRKAEEVLQKHSREVLSKRKRKSDAKKARMVKVQKEESRQEWLLRMRKECSWFFQVVRVF